MNAILEKMRMIKSKIKVSITKIGRNKRNKKLKTKDFTIISNNCYAGIIYTYLNLRFNTPTIGLYFFADDYIKFLNNIKHYVETKPIFINYKESKYVNELIKNKQENKLIAKIDDIEVVFLHYNNKEEAIDKWISRGKRINYDKLIVKFNDQNLCNYQNIVDFDNLDYENKIFFSSKNYKDIKSLVWMKKYKNKDCVKDDAFFTNKYLDIIEYVNCRFK